MRVLEPPQPLDVDADERSVFLAGSIDLGNAIDWQAEVIAALEDLPGAILNPRRRAWDASWPQDIAFAPFREQVEWELAAQERASIIAMYFAPNSQAPITLLELGLFARSGRLVVCCPEGYWRKGNVDVVCATYGAPQVPDLGALIAHVRGVLA
jgi:hypothetical protein